MAIRLNILSTMFYSKTIKNLALANMTVSDYVSPSPKRGGGAETTRRPSKSANVQFGLPLPPPPTQYFHILLPSLRTVVPGSADCVWRMAISVFQHLPGLTIEFANSEGVDDGFGGLALASAATRRAHLLGRNLFRAISHLLELLTASLTYLDLTRGRCRRPAGGKF